jgi:hypothetical protein
MKLVYGGSAEVKPITGKVLKALSAQDPTIKTILKAISDVKDPGKLAVIDALRIVRLSWTMTYEQDFMIQTKYCSKCTSLNEVKIDMVDHPVEKPEIHKGEIDFFGTPVSFTPLIVDIYDNKDLNNLSMLEAVCSISIDDLTLPKIKALSELLDQEAAIIMNLMGSTHKCCNDECDGEIAVTIDLSESFFVQ